MLRKVKSTTAHVATITKMGYSPVHLSAAGGHICHFYSLQHLQSIWEPEARNSISIQTRKKKKWLPSNLPTRFLPEAHC